MVVFLRRDILTIHSSQRNDSTTNGTRIEKDSMDSDESRQLRELLRQHGLRPTRARCLLLELLSLPNNHLSTEEIVRTLAGQGHRVGTATLYQNLDKLVQAGLLLRFTGPDGLARYDFNLTPHSHLICRRCRRVQDIDTNTLFNRRFLPPLCHHTGKPVSDWQIDDVQLELKGLCPACRNRQKPAK